MVKHNTELELFLLFKTPNVDTAIAQWDALKHQFAAESGGTLTVELYRKFVHFMEIPPEQGNVQIYVPDKKLDYDRCLHIFLWDENGNVQAEEALNQCKSKSFDVFVDSMKVKKIAKGKSGTVSRKMSESEVFDGIMRFARARYLRDVPDRRPEISQERRTTGRLTFVVEDLCKEVLTDEERSLWCRIVEACGGICNDVTRERLEFEFEYESETGRLHCDITGKFGSGVYRPRSPNAWMSMEPDFEGYLERYAARLGTDIQQFLKQH